MKVYKKIAVSCNWHGVVFFEQIAYSSNCTVEIKKPDVISSTPLQIQLQSIVYDQLDFSIGNDKNYQISPVPIKEL